MGFAVQQQNSRLDSFKLAGSFAILVAAVGAFYWFSEQSMLVRVVGVLAAAGIAVTIALQTASGRNLWAFSQDVRSEVRKVVWPTRTETIQTTLVVLMMVIVMAIILWAFDALLLWGVKSLTGQGG
jgi:preprotein translocase subunit SecE